jgi:hypothetical protein
MKANQDAGWRRPRGLWAALVVAAILGGGAAAAEVDSPSFYIETITVETQRLSPDIVVSESLLREGEEYTEAELREAVHRINRLPFVLLAEFSLRKGSERGRYELVVKVFEARRWFFEVGGDWDLEDPVVRLDPRVDRTFDSRIGDTTDELRSLVGRRFAVGSRGLLFASFGSEDGAFALGYQRYNLWDRNILLSLSIGGAEEIGNVVVGDGTLSARAQLGIPIRGNHALRLLTSWSGYDDDFLFGGENDREEIEAEVAWVFNSLDDPVLPREGSLYEAGLTWSDLQDTRFLFDIDGNLIRFDFSERRVGVIASAGRHWPVAERQSFSVAGRGFFGEGQEDSRIWEAEASVGHQVFLVRRLELEKWRELRLETQLSGLRQDFSALSPGFGFSQVVDSWEARTGLTYRNGWGVFRFFVNYADREFR